MEARLGIGMAGFLAGDVTRSEHNPDVTLAPRHDAYDSMHTVTGAFADPSLEVAFAVQLFRSAYQGHLPLGMAIARAPSSISSGSIAPPPTWEQDGRQHYADVEAQRARVYARVMAEQLCEAPPNLWWVEAGRQWLAERAGVKRGRPALVAPTCLVPGARPGLERVEQVERVKLAELQAVAALVEMAGDETVAALQNVISSGHVSSTCSTAQAPRCGVVPAQTNLQMAGAMRVAQLPHVLRTWDPSPLQAKFHALVMCNFTPRNPRELPPSRWVSYDTLFRLFQPHAPVWQVGPGNLKQLIIKWFQGHPAFAGLVTTVWCKRIRVTEQSRTIYKFSFEHTPQ